MFPTSASSSTHSAGSNVGVSVPGQPSARPELRTISFSAAEQFDVQATTQPMQRSLDSCRPAAEILAKHEEDLSSTGVVNEGFLSLPKLEQKIQDLAQQDVCQGILYATFYEHEGNNFTRIIEHGCMDGVSCDQAVCEQLFDFPDRRTTTSYKYHIFSDQDLTKKNRKRQNPEIDEQDRTGQNFKRGVDTASKLLHSLESVPGSSGCLTGGVVFLLKRNSKRNSPKDRFFYTFGHQTTRQIDIESALNAFRNSGAAPRPRMELISVGSHSTIQQQLDAISSIGHDIDGIPRADNKDSLKNKYPSVIQRFVTCKEMTACQYLPYSLRPRLLHFLLQKQKQQMVKLLRCLFPDLGAQGGEAARDGARDGAVHGGAAVAMEQDGVLQGVLQGVDGEQEPAVATSGRQHLITEGQEERVRQPASTVVNMASELTAFDSFTTSMLMTGSLRWVKHDEGKDVFAMNAYASDSSVFQADSFTLVEVSEGRVVDCQCKVFKLLQTTDQGTTDEGRVVTCLHCRFFEEKIGVQLMEDVQKAGFPPATTIERLLRKAWLEHNGCCQLLGFGGGKVRKFCVRGTDDSVSFVHLSLDGSFVKCLSGQCSVLMGFRKKLQNLADGKVCPHLDKFRASQEQWEQLVPSPAEEEAQQQTSRTDVFNTDTGLWDFGGWSKHRPTARNDTKLQRNASERLNLRAQLPINDNGYLTGHVLQPPVPNSCHCGAGFESVDEVDGSNLERVHFTTLYTEVAAVKCEVRRRRCTGGCCVEEYNPDVDSIFFWTMDTCIVDEVGYFFLDELFKANCSFSAFCSLMNNRYRQYGSNLAPFVSVPTFLNWFFSWTAAMRIDFRESRDPWCKDSPKVLAGDGTHVGVSLRLATFIPIEDATLDDVVTTQHRRYDRVFLFQRDGLTKQGLKRARAHLKAECSTVMGNDLAADRQPADDMLLLEVCPDEAREIVQGLLDRSFNQSLLLAIANVLFILGCDNPVSALLPHSSVEVVQKAVQDRDENSLRPLASVSPELKLLLERAITEGGESWERVEGFVVYLCGRVLSMHQGDHTAQAASAIPGTYNPPSGVAYYFTPTGEKVRQLRKYEMDSRSETERPVDENCKKNYAKVSQGGWTYMFLWFCPAHGHCYGFHLISGGEGRKDPFASLMQYLPEAPDVLFYDNACQLSEYSLNREPAFFRDTRFFHDIFHGYSHKCAKTFNASRLSHHQYNSEICEQFNARLKCIRNTGSHLSQPRLVFLTQLVMHFWNEDKSKLFKLQLDAAKSGMK